MAAQLWCRLTILDSDGAEVASHVLAGAGPPELGAVNDVARLALGAERLGGRIVVTEISPALSALFELCGLRVQVEGQSEQGEEPLGVQEVQEQCHPGDLAP